MADRLALRGLRAHGRHGVLAEERTLGQPFLIDVSMALDTSRAAADDDLGATVDYGLLAGDIVALVEGEPVALLETLAARVAALCLRAAVVDDVEVTVHKPAAPIRVPFDDVAVTVRRSRT